MASPSIDQTPISRVMNQIAGAEALFPGRQDIDQETAPANVLPNRDPQDGDARPAVTAAAPQAAPSSSGWEYGPGIVGTRPTSAAPEGDGRGDDSGNDDGVPGGNPIDFDTGGDGGDVDDDGDGDGDDDGGQGDDGGLVDDLLSGVTGDDGGLPMVDSVVPGVTQVVNQAVGSGGTLPPPLGDLLGGDGLGLDGLTDVTGLVQDVVSGIGGNGLVPDLGNVLTPVLDPVLGGQGNISLDGLLDAVGGATGGLVDGLLEQVAGDDSLVGGALNAIGDDILGGTVGGSGLLAGTPLAGLVGDGALLSTGVMQGDNSASSGLLQLGAGNDPSRGLLNIDAASEDGVSESGHIVGLQAGPQTSGTGLETDLLGAERDSSGSLVDGGIGQHDGPSVVDINALTAADSFEFPALNGAGLDSLVGTIGVPVGGGEGNLLPVSIGLDGETAIDIGAEGLIDVGGQTVQSGTDVMLNTPFHA